MKKIIFAASIFLFVVFFSSASAFQGRRILSFELDYLSTGLKYNGWGLGVNYEIQCFNFLSIRPGFSHTVLFPTGMEMACITVGVKCGAFFYPFFVGLEGPYVGGEFGTAFCMFRGDHIEANEIGMTVTPILGWKFSIFNYVFLDAFFGYQFLVNKNNFSSNQLIDLYGDKFIYGVRVKLNLKKIWQTISQKSKKTSRPYHP